MYPYMTHFKLGSHIGRKLATVKGKAVHYTCVSLKKLIQH